MMLAFLSVVLSIGLQAAAQTPAPKPTPAPTTIRDAAPNQPPAGTGLIAGVLSTGDSGRAVRRARVSISGGEPRIARVVTTDDRGNFSFADLPAGQFTLSATKPGYLESTYGQKRPGSGRQGTPIELAPNQHIDHLSLQIPRGGVLTGTIFDELGDPALGTTVRAMRHVMRSGERVLQQAGTTQTDDRGIYRISGLLPGDYIVSATPRDADLPQVEVKLAMEEMVANIKIKAALSAGGDTEVASQDVQKMLDQVRASSGDPANEPTSGYAPVYYPGTTIGASASIVTLDISEEKSGVDVALQVVPLARVTGVVASPDSALPAGAQVMLFDNGQAVPGTPARTSRPGPDGRFTFAGVPQGQYTLVARSSGGVVSTTSPAAGNGPVMTKLVSTAPSNQYWAIAEVTADSRGASPITLNLLPGMSVAGKLAFEGGAAPTDLSRVRLSLFPVGQGVATELAGGIRPAGVDTDGRFTFVGVVPGRYRLALASSTGLNGWIPKSAVVAGQDILDIPLDVKPGENVTGTVVTLSSRHTDLSGTLQGPTGRPTADYTIVVFASDARYWTPQARRVQGTRPATDGRFSFRDLPPGDYRLAAVSDVETGQWFDPAFLRQLVAASMTVSLGEGERKVQDLRVAGR